MRVRLRRRILTAVCDRGSPVQQFAVIDECARTIRRDWSRIPWRIRQRCLSAVAVTRTFACTDSTASWTDGDTSMTGGGDEGAAGVAAPAIALEAWILLTLAMSRERCSRLRAGTNRGAHAARGDGHAPRQAEEGPS